MTSTPNQATEPAAELIASRISGFLEERTKISWAPEADLFESGSVSSLFAMELVAFLEDTFDVEIAGRDLRLDNFRTVRVMTGLVQRLRESEVDDRG
jgi:methoxymalonate biosynthesis acyl carrier protein